MAYAEKRGNLWRARWRGPDGTLESRPGFTSRKAAEDYGREQESAIRTNTYVDPRAGQITLTEWVNMWFPAQDLELNTLTTYKYQIEVLILPAFGYRTLRSLEAHEIAALGKAAHRSGIQDKHGAGCAGYPGQYSWRRDSPVHPVESGRA